MKRRTIRVLATLLDHVTDGHHLNIGLAEEVAQVATGHVANTDEAKLDAVVGGRTGGGYSERGRDQARRGGLEEAASGGMQTHGAGSNDGEQGEVLVCVMFADGRPRIKRFRGL